MRQDLVRRREELVLRSSSQRMALVVCAEPLVRKAAALDRVVRYVRDNAAVTTLAVAAIAFLVPRKVLALASRAITLYALFRR